METSAIVVWGKLILACLVTYYVWRDSEKNQVPYRNAWICVSFILFPIVIVYEYYKYHLKKKRGRSSLWHREMEMRKRIEEQQIKLRAERRAWEEKRREEMALNNITKEELEAVERKRAEEKAARMKELEEERLLQEEAIAKQMHIKK